jgi:voltage-gated sodium channel
MSQSFSSFINGKSFHQIVSVAIILCSIILGIETFYPEHKFLFDVIDWMFTTFFACEIILRLLAEENILNFFKLWSFKRDGKKKFKFAVEERGFWNWFDFAIVVVTIVSLFSHFFEHPEFLIVSRLFRVLRVLRLLEISDELKSVERKIVSIIPTIFSFALLLGILIYIYSIIGVYLFSHHQYKQADFSSLGHAFLTLFQLMTLDGWSDMMYAASDNYNGSWLIKGYFVSFVVLTAIVSFNVFVAVLTSQVHEKFIEDQKKADKKLAKLQGEISETEQEVEAGFKELLNEIRSLRSEVAELKKGK